MVAGDTGQQVTGKTPGDASPSFEVIRSSDRLNEVIASVVTGVTAERTSSEVDVDVTLGAPDCFVLDSECYEDLR